MGNTQGKGGDSEGTVTYRSKGITGGAVKASKAVLPKLPTNAVKISLDDFDFIENSFAKLLLFNKLETSIQRKVVQEMYERQVSAGEILIKEGDTGLAATELYVVKSGKFEVITSPPINPCFLLAEVACHNRFYKCVKVKTSALI